MTLLKQLTAKATQAVAVLQLVTRAVAVSLCCRWWSLTCARCHCAAHEHCVSSHCGDGVRHYMRPNVQAARSKYEVDELVIYR